MDDLSQPAPSLERAVRSKPLLAMAFGLIAAIAVADFLSKGATLPVAYAVPLILIVRAGYTAHLRSAALLLIFLAYAVYFAKQLARGHTPPEHDPLDFRFVNHTFAAVMIGALAMLLKLRASAHSHRADLKLAEAELSAKVRAAEDHSDAKVALLIAAALTVEIAIADIISPANYNLAILYMVPLFLCAWTRQRRLLWVMLAAALILNPVGYLLGPTSTHVLLWWGIPVNRVLTALVTMAVAVLLHFRIDALGRANSEPSEPRSETGAPA